MLDQHMLIQITVPYTPSKFQIQFYLCVWRHSVFLSKQSNILKLTDFSFFYNYSDRSTNICYFFLVTGFPYFHLGGDSLRDC